KIVPIDANRGDAVRARLHGDRAACRLLRSGHADGPVVVLADKNDGHFVDARKVHRVVEIGLARSAVASEPEGDALALLDLHGPSCADRLRELRADARRPRDLMHHLRCGVARLLPTLEHVAAVAEDLCDELVEREATHEHDALLSESLEDP